MIHRKMLWHTLGHVILYADCLWLITSCDGNYSTMWNVHDYRDGKNKLLKEYSDLWLNLMGSFAALIKPKVILTSSNVFDRKKKLKIDWIETIFILYFVFFAFLKKRNAKINKKWFTLPSLLLGNECVSHYKIQKHQLNWIKQIYFILFYNSIKSHLKPICNNFCRDVKSAGEVYYKHRVHSIPQFKISSTIYIEQFTYI